MKVLNYLVFVSVLIFILFLSGVVFATIGLIKHREDKKLYMSNVISSASISTIAYYLLLDDTFQDSNVESFDVDSAYTKIELEKVLSEQPSLSIRGNSFLRELLSDDIGESVAEAIKIILEGGDNL